MNIYEVFSTGSKWAYRIGAAVVTGFPTRDDAETAARKASEPRAIVKQEPKPEVKPKIDPPVTAKE